MSDKLTDAKEQLRMASPAEREQDLTTKAATDRVSAAKTTCATTVLVATSETAITQGSTTTAISSRTRTTDETRCTKTTQPVHERQESRPNQEPQQPRQKHRVRIQEDSPTVDDGRRKRPRVVETNSQKMETDQVPEAELPPVPEDDDLNATVIEVMTDVEVLLDGSSVIDVFALNSARRKRVEVSERKLTILA